MNCNFSEKISLLIDGELTATEESRVLAHLSGCEICRQAREDFLLLGTHIKSYELEPDPAAEQRALRETLASEKARWWRRRVALPAPAFALLLVALVALAVWIVVKRVNQTQQMGTGEQIKERAVKPRATESPEGAVDFSRYDGGGRAVIYKTRREQPAPTRQ
jgi:predicted anti-sigma-YlaC factor YlaD